MVEKLPNDMIDRPKMPRATWDALRSHIVRERLRKKQEHEQNQEFERQKMEREHKKKQEALTLEDTKEQIANLETKLTQLKEEKHQLFHTLKKVLYEDEHRRRSKEVHHPGQMYLQPTVRTPTGGGGHGAHSHGAHMTYMKPHPQMLMQGASTVVSQQPGPSAAQAAAAAAAINAGVKRQRSPSPPRTCAPAPTLSVGLPTSYYRNSAGKYGAASTTGTSSAASIYPTTATTASHYSSYLSGAATTVAGQPTISVAGFPSSARVTASGVPAAASAADARILAAVAQQGGPVPITLPTTTVQGGIGRSSSSAYGTSLAAASAERERQVHAQHTVVGHAVAHAAQAAAVLQAQQRQQSAAAAAVQLAAAASGQSAPPPAAHGGSQPSLGGTGSASSFRAGSIMTGYPRYQQPPISTVGGGPSVVSTGNLTMNRSTIVTAPPSVRGVSSVSVQSAQPPSNGPPGHGPPSSARFYQREV